MHIKIGLILLILQISYLHAQELSPDVFQHFTSNEGLSQQTVRAIAQDKNGFIWIGTEDGLNRFDGYDFKTYYYNSKDPHSLPDNFIYTLTPSRDGGMWVGTNTGGLAKYNPATDNFTVYKRNPSVRNQIPDLGILSICEDSLGNVWIGTSLGGLFYLETKTDKVTSYLHDENNPFSIFANNVFDITLGDKNTLWVRTNLSLDKLDLRTKKFYHFPQFGYLDNLDTRGSLYLDKERILWYSGTNALIKFNTLTNQLEKIKIKHFVDKGCPFSSICPRDDKHLWLAGYEGIYLFDKTNNCVHSFVNDNKNPESIFPGLTLKILQDRTGSLWVGSSLFGISKLNLNKKKFLHYKNNPNRKNSLSSNIVRSIMVDSKDNTWVSLVYSGLDRIRPSSNIIDHCKGIEAKNGRLPVICCLMEGPQGNIWAGTWDQGILILSPKTLRFIQNIKLKGDEETSIKALRMDRWGNIWIGKETGLEIYNPNTAKRRQFINDPGNPNSILPLGVQSNCIITDVYQNTWIATWGGLTKMIPKDLYKNSMDVEYTFERFVHNDADSNTISDNRVISLYYDSSLPGEIFAGTCGGGINRIGIRDKHIKVYTHKDGLPNDVIYNMLGDKNHQIWISTNNGLSRFDPASETFRNYTKNDGLQDKQFYWGAACKGNHDELLFGGVNGLNIFEPLEIIDDTCEATVVLTSFKIFNKPVEPGRELDGRIILDKAINLTDHIILNYSENFITFEFAGLHYAFPKENQYKYKLEGLNKDWIEVNSNQRFITFTNLRPGNYVFKVKASNYDGIWTKEEKSVRITILPPFWATLWFKLLIIFIVCTLLVSIYYFRTRAIRKENFRLERLVLQRTSELQEKNKILNEQAEELITTNSLLKEQSESLIAFNTLLEEKNCHIEEQKEELEAQKDQLSELNATKDKLFSILAHDLRNPFHVAISFSDLILRNFQEFSLEKIREFIALIHSSSLRGNDLLENLLQWSRTQTGRISYQPKEQQLFDICEETIRLLEGDAQRKNISISNSISYNTVVSADENMLKTILRNLISNAIKFTPAGGSVIVTQIQNGDPSVLEIIVSDTGVGIPEKTLNQLFRIDKTISTKGTEQESGTGLGLIICKEFVERQQGKIWVESKVNQGTSFHFTLPTV